MIFLDNILVSYGLQFINLNISGLIDKKNVIDKIDDVLDNKNDDVKKKVLFC